VAVKRPKKRRRRKEPVSRALRSTIRERELTAYATAKRAGVSVDAVQRFMNAERGLTLATVDKLAAALDLTLCPDEEPQRPRAT
jgi:plasmid maintenance system antidote protein VapI